MPSTQAADVDVEKMALYNLDRARKTMESLSDKPVWEPQDTSSFDCMHYLGNAALGHAAERLGLKPGDRVVDIGSGFSGTGRYLHHRYGADVTGIELQPGIHELAEAINRHNGVSASVRSINGDFTRIALSTSADHIVSFLCICHIPDRPAVFGKAAQVLKPGGHLYVEDFYARGPIDEQSKEQLRDVMSCSYLPTRERYIKDLEEAGFENVEVEDATELWTKFVHERAVAYRAEPSPEPSLLGFYDTIDHLFANGTLGGARITVVNGSR